MRDLLETVLRSVAPRRARRRDRQTRFRQLLLAAHEVAAVNKYALPTLLRSVARPLQARRLNVALQHEEHGASVSAEFDKLFFPTHRPVTADGRTLDDLTHAHDVPSDGGCFRLRLNRDIVLPWAWKRGRLVNALATIGESKTGGAWRWELNHQVQLLLPLRIGLVHGGNHSIVAGIADGEGEVFAEPLDLAGAYEHVHFDGLAFRRKHDGAMLNAPQEEEPGALFEIGRLMHELRVPYDALPATTDERQRALDLNRFEILYQVWLEGRDTGVSVRTGTLQIAMQEAGVHRTDHQWGEILFSCRPFSPDGQAVYTFKPYGPRPVVTDIRHARAPSQPCPDSR